MPLDLADLQSVREFVAAFTAKYDRLDGLVCNAGMVNMRGELKRTKDGFESTTAVSYFGHFLLTELLLDTAPGERALPSSDGVVRRPRRKPQEPAAGGARRPQLRAARLQRHARLRRGEGGDGPLRQGTRRAADRPPAVSAFSVHPGWARSNFGSGGSLLTRTAMAIMRPISRLVSDSSEQSAQTTLHCLLSDDAPQHSGAYFSQWSILYRDKQCRPGGWPMETPNPNANNMDTARQLVAMSYDLVGLAKPS